MDSHTHSSQSGRLEVVETGRRRRWSEDEKLKIVLESLQGPRRVSATARRYGISRTLLLQWRRSFRVEQKGGAEQQIGFVPAIVAPSAAGVAAPAGFAGQALECCDFRLVFLEQIGRLSFFIKRPSLEPLDPDPDQSAGDVVTLGERVKRFARNKFLGDPSFKLDAMGAVSGHGFHPPKARQSRSIPIPQDVHR
jgi:transposase